MSAHYFPMSAPASATKHAAVGQPLTDHGLKEMGMAVRPHDMPLVDLLAELGEQGECRHDPDLHTGPDAFEDELPADRLARQDVAREVCESCPVWDLCLDYALRTRPAFGVWAGHLPYELAALRREVRGLPEAA